MRVSRLLTFCVVAIVADTISTRSSAQASPSHKSGQAAVAAASGLEAGAVANGVYRNKSLGLSWKIPEGWVLRTEEMNSSEESGRDTSGENPHFSQNEGEVGHPTQRSPSEKPSSENQDSENASAEKKSSKPRSRMEESRVLLAAFSRPPEARGEDVNASIVIAAESVASYPGMTEAAQYFGPLTEVAKAQGFSVDEEPYDFAVGTKKLVRGDFHKDVGTRVMRQATLVFVARGYAVSLTVIGGTEDEVEELIDGMSFGGTAK